MDKKRVSIVAERVFASVLRLLFRHESFGQIVLRLLKDNTIPSRMLRILIELLRLQSYITPLNFLMVIRSLLQEKEQRYYHQIVSTQFLKEGSLPSKEEKLPTPD